MTFVLKQKEETKKVIIFSQMSVFLLTFFLVLVVLYLLYCESKFPLSGTCLVLIWLFMSNLITPRYLEKAVVGLSVLCFWLVVF